MTIMEFPGTPVQRFRPEQPQLAAVSAVIDLRGLFGVLMRRLPWIAGAIALFAALGLAVTLTMTPRYEAYSQVLLDPRGLQVLENDLTPRSASSDYAVLDVESQIRVMSSDSVLARVVEDLGLAGDPEFTGREPGLVQRLKTAVFGSAGPADKQLTALRVLQDRVAAYRLDETFIIEVTAWSEDPEKSARIANGIAAAFLEQQTKVQAEVARHTSDALTARLDELRQRLEASERRVEEYKIRNNILSASGTPLDEQQLSRLNEELAFARAHAAEHRSRYQQIRRLQGSGADPDAIAEAIQSPTVSALRVEYAEARKIEAQILEVLGPRHPRAAAAVAQARETRALIDSEIDRLARAALGDIDRAQAKIRSLEESLATAKGEVIGSNVALVALRELEREVETNRSIYTAFLDRARQLDQRQSLNTSNSQIITPALPPSGKAGPSRLLILIGAIAFGGVLGVGLALLREQFDPSIRSADQLAAETGLPVLATVPGRGKALPPTFGGPASDRTLAVCRLYRGLRRAGTSRFVLMASPGQSQTRARASLDLALVAAAQGDKVLLIETDEQSRVLTLAAGKTNTKMGADWIRERASLGEAQAEETWRGVDFLPAGRLTACTDSAPLASESPLQQLKGYDLVVFDGEVHIGDAWARGLVAHVDDIVLVAETGVTRSDTILGTVAVLGSEPHKVRGAILVGD